MKPPRPRASYKKPGIKIPNPPLSKREARNGNEIDPTRLEDRGKGKYERTPQDQSNMSGWKGPKYRRV